MEEKSNLIQVRISDEQLDVLNTICALSGKDENWFISVCIDAYCRDIRKALLYIEHL